MSPALFNILVMNIGSTSTKVACYKDTELIAGSNIPFEKNLLSPHHDLAGQIPERKKQILDFIAEYGVELSTLDIVVSRGGVGAPCPSGIYEVNQAMCDDLLSTRFAKHDSSLGPVISKDIARECRIKAIVVDPPSTDEFHPLARISGLPDIERGSVLHALSQKAAARRAAAIIGRPYSELNFVVAHLGGDISVGAHSKGRVIDSTHGLYEGPFTPERAGGLPTLPLVSLARGQSVSAVRDILVGGSGLKAYLGTDDAREVEEMIKDGDEKALLVFEAMAYQIAKDIGAMATVIKGNLDGIVITGGLAYSERLINWIKDRISFIGSVFVFPGEDEMLALAEGGLRVLKGEEQIKTYSTDSCMIIPENKN
ncbi:MAG TPA: butyrate kinase [Desulfotomaculum sp.]|nr:MAG: putative butyrate kinase [Desulfotomaculum sp. 46_80]HBY03898.1 butyrate kinase [Desulfotomaculum sp.]